MAGSSRRVGGDEGYMIPGEDSGDPLISTRGIEAFGRKVTTTAGHLIGPLADPSTASHYQNAMADLHKQLRRPNLQRSIFSFARTTPTDLVRSKLSTTEIQSRALTYIPDELLADIPDDDSTYSLFEGFKATVPELAKEDKKHKRKMSRGRKLIEDNASESSSPGPPGLHKLKKEKGKLEHKFQMLGIRKHMAESEIKEIDKKIENLARMRQVVLDRLEGLEDEEIAMEHELVDVDERLEDAQEAHDIAVARGQDTPTKVTGEDMTQSPDEAEMDASFMSESIYQKLPAETAPTKMKRQRPVRKRSMPVLHEHFEPGAKIQELQAHTQPVTALDFDVPFGTMVTAALDDTVKVWDLQAGRCIGLLVGHASTVRALQVEDNICATGSMDATVRLWDLSRARYEPEIDNKINKAEEEEEVEESFFDLAPRPKTPETPPAHAMDDTPLFTLDGHVDEVTALYFKDQTLISGSADKTLRQWDLQQGRCVQTLDVMWAAAQASATPSAWGPSGRVSDTTADFVGALQVFDAALACGTADGMVRLWDLRSGQVHKSLVGHTGPVTCLQFDDVHLVTGSLDRSIRIWDLRTGSIFDAYAYDHPITSMMFDARRIVSAAGENVVKVYDKLDGRHWDCGAGALLSSPALAEGQAKNPAIVDRVRIKDGYMTEGRRDGVVGVWTC